MRKLKKALFKIHSWIGIQLCVLLFLVCFTGTLATLSTEMDWLYYPELRASEKGERRPYNELVKKMQDKFPTGKLNYWIINETYYTNDIAYINVNEQRYYVFVDPVKGVVTGSTTFTFQRYFRDFHYYLFMPKYQIGYFIVLICAFVLLVSIITPLFFYKKWWAKLTYLNSGNSAVTFYRSIHRTFGIWVIPFALLISSTGIWYFVERTNLASVSDISNPKAPIIEWVDSSKVFTDQWAYSLDYDRAAKIATEKIAGLKIGNIVPPNDPTQAIYIQGISNVPLVRNRSNRVYIDPTNYHMIGIQRAENINKVMYLNDIMDPLHFGYWGGLYSKVLWFFGGIIISFLIISGAWVATKRLLKEDSWGVKLSGWQFINWIITLVVLAHMYYFLIARYTLDAKIVTFITIILLIMAYLVWHVFIKKMTKSTNSKKVKN